MRVRRVGAEGILLLVLASGRAAAGGSKPPSIESAAAQRCHTVEFDGSVFRGRGFQKDIGGGLEFVLQPVPHGWIVRVLPSAGERPGPDLAEVATPPFHSVNPLLLTTEFGFRAQDVIGWNPRSFQYVPPGRAFAEAERAYRAATSEKVPTREQDLAVAGVVAKSKSGTVRILDAELVPGTADQTRAAGLVASHFAGTAHTVKAPRNGAADPLGEILSLRFRVSLGDPAAAVCSPSTKFGTRR